MIKLFNKNRTPKTHTVIKARLHFIDINGIEHLGDTYKYFDPKTINCTFLEWLSIEYKENGYLKEVSTNKHFSLYNIKEYWLEEVDNKIIHPKLINSIGCYQIYYTSKEVNERLVKESNNEN